MAGPLAEGPMRRFQEAAIEGWGCPQQANSRLLGTVGGDRQLPMAGGEGAGEADGQGGRAAAALGLRERGEVRKVLPVRGMRPGRRNCWQRES